MPFAKVEVTEVEVRLRTEALMPLVKVEVPVVPAINKVPEALTLPFEFTLNTPEGKDDEPAPKIKFVPDKTVVEAEVPTRRVPEAYRSFQEKAYEPRSSVFAASDRSEVLMATEARLERAVLA